MKDEDTSQEQLLSELGALRLKVAELQKAANGSRLDIPAFFQRECRNTVNINALFCNFAITVGLIEL